MVSNKNRKTKYVDLGLTEEAAKAFKSCVKGKTKYSKTMLKMVEVYKSKCPDQEEVQA
jgi:hypothetical protein